MLLYRGKLYRVAKVDEFLTAVQQLKQEYPTVQLELRDHDYLADTVELQNIRVRDTQQGVGSAVMQRLVDLADQHGVTIRAHAEPFGQKMKLSKLKRWYRGFGFQDKGQNWMVRRPRQPRRADFEDIGYGEAGRWGNQGSGMLFTTGERILLLQRSNYVLEPGTWGLPGGAVPEQAGQLKDALQSAQDETTEELGTLPQHRVVDRYVYREPDFRYTTFIAAVEPSAQALDFQLNWENDDWGWFTEDELYSLPLHFGVEEVLQHRDPFH